MGGASYTSPILNQMIGYGLAELVPPKKKAEAMMKTLKWSLLIVFVAGVGFLTMVRTLSPRLPATDASKITDVNQRNEAVVHQPAPSEPVLVRKPPSAVALTPDKTDTRAADIASQPAPTIQVRSDRALAQVNDQAILLKHLVPLQPDEQEQAMTAEEYQSRLNRAIEMELTFQAAAARGVDLTPEQKKRVAGIVQKHQAALQEYRKQGVTWSSVTAAQVEFEQRLSSALMLQQNLVAKEAHVAPAADRGVQARYEQARSELLTRLKAGGKIMVAAL